MNKDQYSLIDRITNNSIVFISVLAIPLNIIIYFALRESEYQFPRYIPPFLGLITIIAAFVKRNVPLKPKLWGFITILYLTGCYNLLLGLIDMASLWLVLAIVYALFISEKKEALVLFGISFLVVLVAGILMMTKVSFIPLQYKFESCQFACVAVRILHFLMIGSLIYYILSTFYREIRKNIADLRKQSKDLEDINRLLEQESFEKKIAQQKLLEAVILTEEQERKRLAADLHDGLGPVLSAVNLFFQAYIDASDPAHKEPIEKKLKAAIDTAIDDVSRIAHNISPHILEKFGFVKALETFTSTIAASSAVQFKTDFGTIRRFDLKRELTLYRTLTELIHNTIKHAGASQITIRCTITNGMLTTYYADNGCGFTDGRIEGAGNGIGFTSLRNRIESLGGTIILKSNPPDGMSAQIEIPLTDGALQ
jgi:signal transduction histidine kinase